MIDVRCTCGRLLLKASTGGSVTIETVCPRCGSLDVVVLPAGELVVSKVKELRS